MKIDLTDREELLLKQVSTELLRLLEESQKISMSQKLDHMSLISNLNMIVNNLERSAFTSYQLSEVNKSKNEIYNLFKKICSYLVSICVSANRNISEGDEETKRLFNVILMRVGELEKKFCMENKKDVSLYLNQSIFASNFFQPLYYKQAIISGLVSSSLFAVANYYFEFSPTTTSSVILGTNALLCTIMYKVNKLNDEQQKASESIEFLQDSVEGQKEIDIRLNSKNVL